MNVNVFTSWMDFLLEMICLGDEPRLCHFILWQSRFQHLWYLLYPYHLLEYPGPLDSLIQLFFEARIRLLQWGIGGNGRGWRLKIRDLRMSRGATAEAEMGYYRYMDKQLRTAKLGNEWTWQLALHPRGCMKLCFKALLAMFRFRNILWMSWSATTLLLVASGIGLSSVSFQPQKLESLANCMRAWFQWWPRCPWESCWV